MSGGSVWESLRTYERARQATDTPAEFPRFGFGLVMVCDLCGRVSPVLTEPDSPHALELWESHQAKHQRRSGSEAKRERTPADRCGAELERDTPVTVRRYSTVDGES